MAGRTSDVIVRMVMRARVIRERTRTENRRANSELVHGQKKRKRESTSPFKQHSGITSVTGRATHDQTNSLCCRRTPGLLGSSSKSANGSSGFALAPYPPYVATSSSLYVGGFAPPYAGASGGAS